MPDLALLGGKKTVDIDYTNYGKMPLVSDEAKRAVMDLLDKGETSLSPVVQEFERNFALYCGRRYAVTVPNGTTSLFESLFALGVGQGNEVLVPSFTWYFSAIPIIALHATPVFTDVDLDTHCISADDIERKISSRTKAIMCVHVWGNPCDMGAIMNIARKHGLKVIEDCAHAHGASYKGTKAGGIGDIAGFSLQSAKHLSAGEGGIILTDNMAYYERCISLGHYERVKDLPEGSPYKKYITGLGYKHRVHPLGIAMANADLENLDKKNSIMEKHSKYLEKGISDIECIIPQKSYPGAERVYSYQYARYDGTKLGGVSRITLLKALKAEGIMVGVCGYGDLHNATVFKERNIYDRGSKGEWPGSDGNQTPVDNDLPNTVILRDNTFFVAPRFESDTAECKALVEQYMEAYHKVVENVDELIRYEKENGISETDAGKSGRSINLL